MNANFATHNLTMQTNVKKCESSHSKAKKIVATHYKNENNMTPALRDIGAPNYIDVLLDNGKTVRYSATRKIESR